jgi:hypothetical protein
MEKLNGNIIRVNLDGYLADFVLSTLKAKEQPVQIDKRSYIGHRVYRLIEKVPEDCRFIEPVIPNKRLLELEINSFIGTNGEERKRALSHYYFPTSRQKEFENSIRDMFNELFFNVVEISKEYTDAQYSVLIENFCNRYNIDFFRYFEMLKKKHYRERLLLNKC